MAEFYIIDGYNLLYRGSEKFFRSVSRQQLLDFLLQYRPQGKNPVMVVFDGYGQKNYSRGSIQVVYSKSYSADEYILTLLQEKKYKNVKVVSDDRELITRAKNLGAKIIKGEEFLRSGIRRKKSRSGFKREEEYEKPSLLSSQAVEIRKELEKKWLHKEKK